MQLLELQPTNSFIKFAIAKEFESLDQTSKSVQWLEDLLEKDPDYTGAYYHLANLRIKLKDEIAALKVIESGLEKCLQRKADHDFAELQNLKMNIQLGEHEFD